METETVQGETDVWVIKLVGHEENDSLTMCLWLNIVVSMFRCIRLIKTRFSENSKFTKYHCRGKYRNVAIVTQ